MPKLVKLYITHVLIGFAIAAVFVGALLALNVANLWHLVSTSNVGVLAVVILWVANGVVFSGVQFAIQIMFLAESEDHGQGGKRDPLVAPLSAPVHAQAKQTGHIRH